jgi:ADP-ribose pyrophosphatase YjhB (NUDIX family)
VTPEIRAVALVILRHGDDILLCEGYDRIKKRTFLRAPGGGIEFGEPAADAARREIREEFDLELGDLRPLGILENLFTFEGTTGHEIIFVFEATWPAHLPATGTVEGCESDGVHFTARWHPLASLHETPSVDGEVVPPGFLALLGKGSSKF